jgi:hypothetical protein
MVGPHIDRAATLLLLLLLLGAAANSLAASTTRLYGSVYLNATLGSFYFMPTYDVNALATGYFVDGLDTTGTFSCVPALDVCLQDVCIGGYFSWLFGSSVS